MKARIITLILILLPLITFAAVEACAETLTVTKTEDTADGVCNADCSLREAVTAAATGDTVAFSPLFSTVPQVITLANGQILINRDLSIVGPGALLVNVSGANLSRIFNISAGSNVSISGVTISNGRQEGTSDFRGGGIRVASSTLTVTNAVLRNNLARYTTPPTDLADGGAIFSENSTLKVTNCEFYGNTAARAGAGVKTVLGGELDIVGSSFHNNNGSGVSGSDAADIRVASSSFISNSGRGIGASGTLSVSDSRVEGNGDSGISTALSADVLTVEHSIIRNNINTNGLFRAGGGIYALGTSIIRSSVVSGNQASDIGGGIANGGTMFIEDSIIHGNKALNDGGGIYNASPDLYLTNSTVSGNTASRGGGLFGSASAGSSIYGMHLANVTVSSNAATGGKGGGLFVVPLTMLALGNSIVGNNTSSQNEPDVAGSVVSAGFNLISNTQGSSGWIMADLLGIDPQLAPLGSNGGGTFTHALLPASPAIDAGSSALAVNPRTSLPLQYDQRGTLRVIGPSKTSVDIGAYEANHSMASVSLVGRVRTFSGRALTNARIDLRGAFIGPRIAVTNHLGYYRFLDLPVAQTYTLTATDKFYSFAAPLVVTTDQNRDDLLLFGSL